VERIPEPDPEFPRFPEGLRADSVEIELAAGQPWAALFAFLQMPEREPVQEQLLLHRIAQAFLRQRLVEEAWQTLLLQETARLRGVRDAT
jgi:hypothetical protein